MLLRKVLGVVSKSCRQILSGPRPSVFAEYATHKGGVGLSGRPRSAEDKHQLRSGRILSVAYLAKHAPDKISLDLELVYGHCWGGGAGLDPANYRIDASRIPLRRG